MKTKFLKIVVFFVLILNIGFTNSCSDDDGQIACNPTYTISASINLSLPMYSELVNPNGWAYVQGEGAGSRGLVVVNTGTGFRAYDRNAPHICPNLTSTLEVIDGIKLHCPFDGGEWILLTGQPLTNTEGFTPDRAPRNYMVSMVGNSLYITN